MPQELKHAFQCKHCGSIAPAEAAGDNALPHACHVCRHGVRFEVSADGTNVNKVFVPENWIVLADLSPEELAKNFNIHGLTPDKVSRHTAKVAAPPQGKTVIVTADETVGIKDKASAQ
jgi:hypothetical protein